MLVLAFFRSRAGLATAADNGLEDSGGIESGAPADPASPGVVSPSTTDGLGPLAPNHGRSAGDVPAFTDPARDDGGSTAGRSTFGSPGWVEDGPVSDFVLPADGWGTYSATCPTTSFLVYAARTEPRKYEYTLCSRSDGSLSYHGIDVTSGAEIRLSACVAAPGRYVAQASTDYRYEIIDGRSHLSGLGNSVGKGVDPARDLETASKSHITLYRSTTEVDWRYEVQSEWGMQNLPPEFVKC